MHVLEDAARVVGHVDPEVLVHPRAPGAGQVLRLQPVVDQILLQLEAQDDVHVVGDLVGVDADQRRVHLVDRAVERLLVHRPELRRERLLQLRVETPPERP